uniref:Putative dna topoisomerase 2-alpha-like protein n=1 Tax=Xenopsylla cheopis TaxID=163159 RepID=A0A6M2DSQ9_XENCH
MPRTFVIVLFVKENDAPDIIASNWLTKCRQYCYYPKVRFDEAKNKLIKKFTPPDRLTWSKHQIRILTEYDTYEEARAHLRKAEETSNVDTDEEPKRIRRKNKKYIDSESEEEDLWRRPVKIRKNATLPSMPLPPSKSSTEIPLTLPTQNTSPISLTPNFDDFSFPSTNITPMSPIVSPSPITPMSPIIPSSPTTLMSPIVPPSPITTMAPIIPPSYTITSPLPMSHLPTVPSPQPLPHYGTPYHTTAQNNVEIQQDLMNISKRIYKMQQRLMHLEHIAMDNNKMQMSMQQQGVFQHSNEITFMDNLPAKTEEELSELEKSLVSEENKAKIVKYLCSVGGKDGRLSTSNMLRRMMHDSVAISYSLTGKQRKDTKKKLAFQSTKIYEIIILASKSCCNLLTEEKIREYISDWLNQAPVRVARTDDRRRKT